MPAGHTLRRVNFEPNAPGQIFVSERDGVHESDVRQWCLPKIVNHSRIRSAFSTSFVTRKTQDARHVVTIRVYAAVIHYLS